MVALPRRYQVVELLGQGGSGEVYLVRDRLSADRILALKWLRAHADALLRSSVEREFATLASLSVAGIARVHDFGLAGGDKAAPFFTRDFVRGSPLDEEASRCPPVARIGLLAQVAVVVARLHQAGVVHGDLKPHNVIVGPDSEVHLIDFGLARVLRRGAGGRPRGNKDDEETSSGTPAFMAPELFRGEPPTAQSDVYALGATLWCVLTGATPYRSLGPGALAAKLGGQRPSEPADVPPVVRRGLEVAWQAMQPEPLDRLATVDEFAAALSPLVPSTGASRAVRPGASSVAPRPRGHGHVLELVETNAIQLAASAATELHSVLLLQGPPGAGKSTLLRELRWRLQLRGVAVLALHVDVHDPLAAVERLLQQARALGDGALADAARGGLTALLGGRSLSDGVAVAPRVVAHAVRGLLGALGGQGPRVVLVDDLDAAEVVLGRGLRWALHDEGEQRLVVVCSAVDEHAAAVRELAPKERVRLPRLSEQDVAALARDVLGAVDRSVARALYAHSDGLPAEVVDALSELSSAASPSAADVRKLPPGQARRRVAGKRLALASGAARHALDALAALGGSCAVEDLSFVCQHIGLELDLTELLPRWEREGLVARHAKRVALADKGLLQLMLENMDAARKEQLVACLLSGPGRHLPGSCRAHAALWSGDAEQALQLVPRAAEERARQGASVAAAHLYERLLRCAHGELPVPAALALASLRQDIGEYKQASTLFLQVLEASQSAPHERARAALGAGRVLGLQCEFEQAVEVLRRVPEGAQPAVRAEAQSELARTHLRRGDYPAVLAAVEQGLSLADSADPVRIELQTSAALAASYRGEHPRAHACAEQALGLARGFGSQRHQATALSAFAITHQRAGNLARARELYEQSLEISRNLGDSGSMASVSLNLGGVLYLLGHPAEAAQYYESAAKLASRAGRTSAQLTARSNLAQLHIYLGFFERARLEVQSIVRDSEAAGLRLLAAQAVEYQGDLAARDGNLEVALLHYEQARDRFRELGLKREQAEAQLDASEALLELGTASDLSRLDTRLKEARELLDAAGSEDLSHRLVLLSGRKELWRGNPKRALSALETLRASAHDQPDHEARWQVLSAIAECHDALAAPFLAARFRRLAIEALETTAARVPSDQRDAFWHDPRRRRLRSLAAADGPDAGADTPSGHGPRAHDARTERLLELIRRLACELDLDRLLDRITESAVELSGAERGLVLLIQGRGTLTPRSVSGTQEGGEDPHAAFSQSIAEAVLIDGEPIVSLDARGDGRFSEYMSVHKLMLRSVACLPIRGRHGVAGVLYLEHRRHVGRFSESDIDLLSAFADQAAIALENARLLQENRERSRELEQANRSLALARDDIAQLLEARTEELEETKRELARARRQFGANAERHGIVGRAPTLRPVFDAIERLRSSSVPVVIQGESGTGKELVARAIHYGGSRAKRPFIVINCASIPEALLESELFGHVRGAFTGANTEKKGVLARASSGTLVLDEVGDMSLRMQVDLLRVLQEGKLRPVGGDQELAVDVRFIACSDRPLKSLVEAGRMREDLYYRLNVVEVVVPPLRGRREDIPLLTDHFLRAFADREGGPSKRLTQAALRRLRDYAWPGNVRQLEHVLLNAWVLTEGETIDTADLSLEDRVAGAPAHESTSRNEHAPRPQPSSDVGAEAAATLEEHRQQEKQRIVAALRDTGWNRAEAARKLQMPRRTFYRRLREYQIL